MSQIKSLLIEYEIQASFNMFVGTVVSVLSIGGWVGSGQDNLALLADNMLSTEFVDQLKISE
jgi:hypothetical protein